MSFNHSGYDPDGRQLGRSFCGILGMAKFARVDSGWQLEIFQRAIGGYGSFSQAPTPEPLLIGNHQYGWVIRHVNGGPFTPYRHDFFLIAETGNSFHPILSSISTAWEGFAINDTGDGLSHWDYKYAVPPTDTRQFRDIMIEIKGRYFAKDTFGTLVGLKGKVQRRQKGNFRISRHFVYAEGIGYEEQLPAKVKIVRDRY